MKSKKEIKEVEVEVEEGNWRRRTLEKKMKKLEKKMKKKEIEKKNEEERRRLEKKKEGE